MSSISVPRLDEAAVAADVPLEADLVRAALAVVARACGASAPGSSTSTASGSAHSGAPKGGGSGSSRRGRTGSRRRPPWTVSVTGSGDGQAQGQ